MDTDNSVVIMRGEGGRRGRRRYKLGKNGDGKRLDLG